MSFEIFAPILFFLMPLSGNSVDDIVTLLPAEDYFQSRRIDTTIEKMMELAAKEPVDGKSSIQQLLALRVLGDDPAKVKKANGFAGHLQILKEIAAGEKAQDKQGFAKEYAAWSAGTSYYVSEHRASLESRNVWGEIFFVRNDGHGFEAVVTACCRRSSTPDRDGATVPIWEQGNPVARSNLQ